MKIRPYVAAAALIALSIGTTAFSPPSSLGQAQPETQRKIVSKVDPVYPELASKMHISGSVRVEAIVAPNGRLKSTQVIGGHPLFTKTALDAIEKWKWAPAPQETKVLIVLNFHP
jgi:TonB family protein